MLNLIISITLIDTVEMVRIELYMFIVAYQEKEINDCGGFNQKNRKI
jgi:hypothetical protein